MRVLSHPFRLDAGGAVATVEQGSDAQAREVAAAVVSTILGERALAPDYGITDPAGRGVDPDEVETAIGLCEPDLSVTYVVAYDPVKRRQEAVLNAVWEA